MAREVFTTDATVQCGHGASASPLQSPRKLTVGQKPVITETELLSASFPAGCSQTNTSGGQLICQKVVAVGSTKAAKLTAGSIPVIVAPLGGQTSGAPKNTDLTGTAGQAKLTAS
jgi:hypothetical protein